MPIYTNIDGTQKQLSSISYNKDGATKALSSAYTNIDNSSKEIFAKSYISLSNISAGSIVKMYTTLSGENKLTDFIVLGKSNKKDSILLLQKYLYESRVFNSESSTEYSTSDIDKYLSAETTESNSYSSKLPEDIRNCLVKTTIGSYSYASKTTLSLSRDIFLMSYTEVGLTNSTLANEGDSYLDALKIAAGTTVDKDARIATTESGSSNNWWLRSPYNSSYVRGVNDGDSSHLWTSSVYGSNYVRPLLSVAPATLVEEDAYIVSHLPK